MSRIVSHSPGRASGDDGRLVATAVASDGPASGGSFDTPPPATAPPPRPFDQQLPPTGTVVGLPHVPGYEVLSELGHGGMGVVYRARHVALKRVVALKMLRPGVGSTEPLLQRFRTESEAAARLQHPNIVRVYEVDEVGGQPVLVMEWVNGGSLAAHLAGGPMPPTAAAAVVAVLARAMDYAHRCGIVHRDLKPANVLLEAGDADSPGAVEVGGGRVTPKVSDFGLAKQLDSDDDQTRTGAILGTPCYMAPEQAGGDSRDAGPVVDVYALGVILYEALTGRPPFRAATVLETLEQVRTADPPPPERFQPKLPRDLRTVCLKCLEKQPGRRYPSAADLAADLERFARGVPILARPVGTVERTVRWAGRRPTAAALVGVCVVAVAGSLVGLLAHNSRLRGEVERTRLQEVEARRQKSAALAHVRQGHEALEDIFNSLANPPVGVLGNESFRAMWVAQGQSIVRYYHDILRDGDDTDPEVRFSRGMVAAYAGRMQIRLKGHAAAAEADFRRATELLGPLAADPDADPAVRREWAECWYWFGTLLQQTGRAEEAERSYRTAAAALGADDPPPRHRMTLARCHTRLAELAVERQDWKAAEAFATEAVGKWDRLLAADPSDINQQWAVVSLRHRGFAHWLTERWDALEADVGRAEVILGDLSRPPARRAGVVALHHLSELYRMQAYGRTARGQPAAAVGRLTAALGLLDTADRAEPGADESRALSARLYRDRAIFGAAVGEVADALADWDRAVERSDKVDLAWHRIERAEARSRLDDWATAATELIGLAGDDGLSADQAAMLGRTMVMVAKRAPPDAAGDRRKDELQRVAMACIRRAVAGGHFREAGAFERYAADPAFDGVRPKLAALVERLP